MGLARVEVRRGAVVESRHEVSVAVADGDGVLRATAGDPELFTYARSAIKPLQALPLVQDDVAERFGFGGVELAVACASHGGEPCHVEAVQGMLQRIGLDEHALACGAHPPMYQPAAQALRDAGRAATRIHNNCSGKHAGMLALARAHGWPVAGYHDVDHPVQQRMLQVLTHWSGVAPEEIAIAADGCGVATFALPLSGLARAFGAFAAAARRGERGPATIVKAMANHPEYVAGTARLCTELTRASGGRIIAKVGAEGVYCAAVPGAELGIALKVEDGARRAAEPALLAVLHALGVLSDDEIGMLARYAEPVLRNTRGERVGELRAVVELEPADA
ncbi:MAG: asparaginase [Longimicrobiales bacterium]